MQTTALRLLNDSRYETACDYDQMVLSTLIETPPGWPDLTSFLTELTSHLGALHNPHGHRLLYQSLRQGTETTQDLARSEDPVIQALFRAFAAPIARYRDHIGQGEDALRRRNRGPTRFNGGWSVRLHRDGYHTSHVHPRGWISSACYIQLPDCMRSGHTAEGSLELWRARHADDALTPRGAVGSARGRSAGAFPVVFLARHAAFSQRSAAPDGCVRCRAGHGQRQILKSPRPSERAKKSPLTLP